MKEIPEVTGMRGYASLGVIFFHLITISGVLQGIGIPPIVYSWNSGVDFFFVLSGFLLSIPFMEGKGVSLRAYYTKRIFRIFPVYYLCITLCGSLLLLFRYATAQQVVASLLFVQSFNPSTFNSINGVSWTLVIEEIFYATLPVFSLLFVGGKWRFSLPLCVAASLAYRFAMVDAFSSNNIAFHLWQYPSFIGHFAIGATLANFYANDKMRIGMIRSSIPALFVVAVLLGSQYAIGSTYSIFNNVMPLPGIILAFEYGAVIFFALTTPVASKVRSIFTNRAATFAGRISYSSYTWHLPIETWLFRAGLQVGDWVVASVAIALVVATLSYRYLESPFLRRRNRFLSARGWR